MSFGKSKTCRDMYFTLLYLAVSHNPNKAELVYSNYRVVCVSRNKFVKKTDQHICTVTLALIVI